MDIRFWKGVQGEVPVEIWLRSLSSDKLGTALSLLARLRHFGVESMGRHSKNLKGPGDGLFELKDKPSGLRVYYCHVKSKSMALILAAGSKGTQQYDIQMAQGRRKSILKGDLS